MSFDRAPKIRFVHTLGVALVAAWTGPAWGQSSQMGFETGDGKVHVRVHEIPEDPLAGLSKERRRWLAGAERELRKINAEYFRSIRNTQIRQVGISKLRQYDDPALWPTMLDVFDDAKLDVQTAMLDMFFDAASDEGDATLAWIATFEEDEAVRKEAAARLDKRLEELDEPSERINSVVAYALKTDDDDVLANAAKLANRLNLVRAIPGLINAQISGTTAQAGRGGGEGALAYILVGQQITFVSDLTPVIGDSAVGFDPEVAVATDGVVLSVDEAVVITYRLIVHNALVDLSSRAWGRATDDLGWDDEAWRDWYANEFRPYLERQKADELASGTPEGDGPG